MIRYEKDVRIIHFIGKTKPWLQPYDRQTDSIDASASFSYLQPFLKSWWNIFYNDVHPQLKEVMVRIMTT